MDDGPRCAKRGCPIPPTTRITYGPGRRDLFCSRHADAKCEAAEAKGVFLTPEPLANYDPDLEG